MWNQKYLSVVNTCIWYRAELFLYTGLCWKRDLSLNESTCFKQYAFLNACRNISVKNETKHDLFAWLLSFDFALIAKIASADSQAWTMGLVCVYAYLNQWKLKYLSCRNHYMLLLCYCYFTYLFQKKNIYHFCLWFEDKQISNLLIYWL